MRLPNIAISSKLWEWNSRIKQLSSDGKWGDIFLQYKDLRRTGAELSDPSLISTILKACTALSFSHGESVHACLLKQGLDSFTSIANSTLDFYMRCGDLGCAFGAFTAMSSRDSVSWNILIRGFLQEGALEDGLWWFREARLAEFEPNVSTLVLLFQAFRKFGASLQGLMVHAYIIRSGFGTDPLRNSLLGMYAVDHVENAQKLFDEMRERDVISWSTMIGAYIHNEEARMGLKLFKCMMCEAMSQPDEVTTVSVLNGCSHLGDVILGRLVHGFVVCRGFDLDIFVGNSLIDMYSKCNDTDSAIRIFYEMPQKNIVTWNSILSGLVRNGNHREAVELFRLMRNEGILVDEVTVVNLLQTCKYHVDPNHCKLLHNMILRRGYESNILVMNSQVDAYAKCNLVELAWKLFCWMSRKDMVAWSTMIAGFTHSGKPDEAVAVFRKMGEVLQEKPNKAVILNLLEACAVSADIRVSKWAHGLALRSGWVVDVAVGTAILDMYSKCGAVEAARRAFDQIPCKNVVSWSAMIAAYGMNGLPDDAISLFAEMKQDRSVKPNAVTALSLLSACSHGGLVEKGLCFFQQMVQDDKIDPTLEHYACVVDMLARAGKLEHAMELIRNMPQELEPGASLWGAVLSACRSHGDMELGAGAFARVLELEPLSSAGYLLASSMYAEAGLWADAATVRLHAKERGVRELAGHSSVSVNNRAYRFVSGDESHPLAFMIRAIVKQLHVSSNGGKE